MHQIGHDVESVRRDLEHGRGGIDQAGLFDSGVHLAPLGDEHRLTEDGVRVVAVEVHEGHLAITVDPGEVGLHQHGPATAVDALYEATRAGHVVVVSGVDTDGVAR